MLLLALCIAIVGAAIVLSIYILSILDVLLSEASNMLTLKSKESIEQKQLTLAKEFQEVFGSMPQEIQASSVDEALVSLECDAKNARVLLVSLRRVRISNYRKVIGKAQFDLRQATNKLNRAQTLAQHFGFFDSKSKQEGVH